MRTQRKAGATKKRRSSNRKNTVAIPKLPHWGSFAFGLISGIILTSVIYFNFATSEVTLKIPTSQSTNQPMQAGPVITQKESPKPIKPKFDFYSELTKSQPANKSKTLDLKTPPKAINGYLVQAGSFRKRSDAEALKAQLALSGIMTRIESVTLNANEIWYRVLTSSFKQEKSAQAQQKALKSLGHESIIVHRYAE